MDYKKSYILYIVCLCAGGVLGCYALITGIHWLGAVSIAILIAAVVQAEFFHRCPGCGARLSLRGKRPLRCPGCGQALGKGSHK